MSGGGDGLIKVWDAQTGDNTFTMVGHTGEVVNITYTSNNQRLRSVADNDQGQNAFARSLWFA